MSIEDAAFHTHQAEHTLTDAYALFKEPKLLLAIIKSLHEAHNALKQEFPDLQASVIDRVSAALKAHQKSPVTFPRQEKLVICDETYSTITLSEAQVRQDLQETKDLLTSIL